MNLVFYNVNEDGWPYERHMAFVAARVVLEEFPNDSIVVVTEGSPTDKLYAQQIGFES